MTNAKQITCRRCKGSGFLAGVVLSQGRCFGCMGRGTVFADKFDEMFRDTSGDWFGFSRTDRAGVTHKSINRCSAPRVTRDVTVTQITEEQARKFFARYGLSTTVRA